MFVALALSIHPIVPPNQGDKMVMDMTEDIQVAAQTPQLLRLLQFIFQCIHRGYRMPCVASFQKVAGDADRLPALKHTRPHGNTSV